MCSTATISRDERASSRYGWGVPDGYNGAAYAFGSSLITGRARGFNRSREM